MGLHDLNDTERRAPTRALRLERMYKVLVVAGATIATQAACSDGGEQGEIASQLADGAAGSAGSVSAAAGSGGSVSSNSDASPHEDAATEAQATFDATAPQEAGSDAAADGVDTWLAWG
jgi:hypothetical protein